MHVMWSTLNTEKITFYQRFFLILFLFLSRFPFVHETFAPGLDSPLIWIFNYLHYQKPFSFPDIAFPYGPLAFIMFPMYKNFFHTVLFHLVIVLFLWFGIESIIKKIHQTKFLFVTFIFTFLSLILLSSLNIILLISILYLYCWLKEDYAIQYFAVSVFWAVVLFFIKISSGVTAFAFIYCSLLIGLWEKKILATISALFLSLFIYAFVGFLLFGAVRKAFHFFLSAFFVSSANNDIALYNHDHLFLMSAPFILFFILHYLSDDEQKIKFVLISIFPLFIEFKHGFTRKDTSHIHDLLQFFTALLLLYLTTQIDKKNFLKWIFSYLILFFTHANVHDTFNTENFALFPYQNNILINGKIYENKDADVIYHQVSHSFTDSLTFRKLKGKTADVFPWDQTFLLAHQIKWKSRPSVLMNNNEYCDSINADFLLKDTPQYIILRKIFNFEGAHYSSLDDGYLFNQEPKFLHTLLEHYYPDTCLWDAIILKKRINQKKLKSEKMNFNKIHCYQYYKIPSINNGEILKICIKPNVKISSVIKNILYKPDPIWVRLITKENITLSIRCNTYTLEKGIWLKPLLFINNIILHPEYFTVQTHQFDSAELQFIRYTFTTNSSDQKEYFFSDKPYVKLKNIHLSHLRFSNTSNYHLSHTYRKDTLLIDNSYSVLFAQIKFDTLPRFYGFGYIRIPICIQNIKHIKEIKIRLYKKQSNGKFFIEKEFSMANFYKKDVIVQCIQFPIYPWEIDSKSEYILSISNLANVPLDLYDSTLHLFDIVKTNEVY